MKDFEYNWATAEMVKLYLRNSRAQAAREARMATELSTGTQEVPTTNGSGASHPNVDSDSDSSEESESESESGSE